MSGTPVQILHGLLTALSPHTKPDGGWEKRGGALELVHSGDTVPCRMTRVILPPSPARHARGTESCQPQKGTLARQALSTPNAPPRDHNFQTRIPVALTLIPSP